MADTKTLSRRALLRAAALTAAGVAFAACQPKVVEKMVKETVEVEKIVKEVVKETVIVAGTPQVVEKEVTKVVKEIVEEVVTATPAPKGPVTIRFTSHRDPKIFDLTIDMVKEKGIDLKVDQTPFGGGWTVMVTNLITRIAGGEDIDALNMCIEGVRVLGDNDILLPLDPYLEMDVEARKDIETDMHPVLVKMLQYKGKQLLIPFWYGNMLMHYNPVIFEKKGIPQPTQDWTWDDFLTTSLALAEVKGTKDDLYAFHIVDEMFRIEVWYLSNDTSYLKNDWADSNLDDPKFVETVQFLADLILKHKVCPSPVGWDEGAQFMSGHMAMRGSGGWTLGGYRKANFTNWALQLYPHKAGPFRTVVGSCGPGILTRSKHRDEAWTVCKAFFSPEMQMYANRTAGDSVARRSVMESKEYLGSVAPAPADLSLFYNSLDYAAPVPAPKNFNLIEPIIRRHYALIWTGDLSVDEALKSAHKEVQAEMDKIKKK